MIENPQIDPDDELVCLGHGEDTVTQGGAMSPPIVQTSLFAHRSTDDLTAGLAAEHQSHVYTLGQNPTVESVETKLARLERGEGCKVLGSGMAAISAVFLGLLESGTHVLFVNNTYGPTLQLAERLRAFGIEHEVVLSSDLDQIAAAIKPETRLVWVESQEKTDGYRMHSPLPVEEVSQQESFSITTRTVCSTKVTSLSKMLASLSIAAIGRYVPTRRASLL